MTAKAFIEKVPALLTLEAGSRWVEIDERIAPRRDEPVLNKLYASAFFGTPFASLLASHQCDSVIVTGASTSGCVRATAVDVLQYGYRPVVPREAVGRPQSGGPRGGAVRHRPEVRRRRVARRVPRRRWRGWLPHTLVEKILLAHCDADDVRPGDVVTVRCDVVMANDVSGPVAFRAMEKMGAERVFDPSRVVMVADHFMPAKDARSAELQARLKRWSEEQGVTYYGQGRGGIEHTLLCEEGWIVPGAVIAGGDSHTCTYGALGAFGTGLGSTDIASCLALGSFWQAVPETIQIELDRPAGELRDRQGRDPRRASGRSASAAGRTRCSSSSARAPRRSRSTSGSRSRTWRSRPARRRASSRPTTRWRPTSRAARGRAWTAERSDRRRDVPATSRDRPVGARAARRAAAPPRQRDDGVETPARSRSTRSTSATARTGR